MEYDGSEDIFNSDSENPLEKEIETLRLELESRKNQNCSLIQIIQKYKLNSSSDRKNMFDLKRNQHKLNVQLNWFQEELSRANSVISVSEEKITGAFKNVMEISRTLSDCKVLLSRLSARFELCERSHNSVPTGNASYVQKNCGQTKHRVGPMIGGHPISKPTIKLQRLKISSQTTSENVAGHAAYPALPATDSALPVAEPLLAVADMALTAGDPELPVSEPLLTAGDQELPVSNPTLSSTNLSCVAEVTPPVVEKRQVDINDCESYIFAMEKNITTTFESLTEASKHLLDGKEAIKQYYSTPARSTDESFNLLLSESPNNCYEENLFQKQASANQTSQRVGPMVEGHTIITNPTIVVERIDAATFFENCNYSPTAGPSKESEFKYICSPVLEDSEGERSEAEGEIDNQILSVAQLNEISNDHESFNESASVINETMAENSETEILPVSDVTEPEKIHAEQSSHRVGPLFEGHAIITNPTIIVERVDAAISQRKTTGRRRKKIIENEDPGCSIQEPESDNVKVDTDSNEEQSSHRVESQAIITNPTIIVERFDATIADQNITKRKTAGRKRQKITMNEDPGCSIQEPESDNDKVETHSNEEQSSHRVGSLVEGHAIITNPTISVERVDATIATENIIERKKAGRRRKKETTNEDPGCSIQEPESDNVRVETHSNEEQSSHRVGSLVEGHAIITNPTISVERVDATIATENIIERKKAGRRRKKETTNEDPSCSIQEPESDNVRVETHSNEEQSSHRVGSLVEGHAIITNPTISVERLDATIATENIIERKKAGRRRKKETTNEDPGCSIQEPESDNVRVETHSNEEQSSHRVGSLVEGHAIVTNPTISVERVDATIATENIIERKKAGRRRKKETTNEDAGCSIQEPESDNVRVETHSNEEQSSHQVGPLVEDHAIITNPTISVERVDATIATESISERKKAVCTAGRRRKKEITNEDPGCSIQEPESDNVKVETNSNDSSRRRKYISSNKESNDNIQTAVSNSSTPIITTEGQSEDSSRRRKHISSNKESNDNIQTAVSNNSTAIITIEGQSEGISRRRKNISSNKEANCNIQERGSSSLTPKFPLEKKSPGRRRKNVSSNKETNHNTQEPGLSNLTPSIPLEDISTGSSHRRQNISSSKRSSTKIQETGSNNSTPNIKQEVPVGRSRRNVSASKKSCCDDEKLKSCNSNLTINMEEESADVNTSRRRRVNKVSYKELSISKKMRRD